MGNSPGARATQKAKEIVVRLNTLGLLVTILFGFGIAGIATHEAFQRDCTHYKWKADPGTGLPNVIPDSSAKIPAGTVIQRYKDIEFNPGAYLQMKNSYMDVDTRPTQAAYDQAYRLSIEFRNGDLEIAACWLFLPVFFGFFSLVISWVIGGGFQLHLDPSFRDLVRTFQKKR